MSMIGDLIMGGQKNKATEKAAQQQADAARYATDVGNQQYQQTRQDLLPLMRTGYKFNDLLSKFATPDLVNYGPDAIRSDPYYKFLQDESRNALQGSAAARGGLYSGNALRALQDRAQNTAMGYAGQMDQLKTNALNRLTAGAQGGQAAIGQVGSFGAQNAFNAGQNAIGAGNARAAATLGKDNTWQDTYNSWKGLSMNALGGFL